MNDIQPMISAISSVSLRVMKPLFAALVLATTPAFASFPGAEALAKLVESEFDLNADGKIDQGEWQAGVEKGFKEMDLDGDGLLSSKELDALNSPIAEEIGDFAGKIVAALIKNLVLTMDADKDGAVSLKEYSTLTDPLFARLDANKDSNVDSAELLELPMKMISK